MNKRMIKVLAAGFAVVGLSVGLATTALAATTTDHAAATAAAQAAAHTAVTRSAAAASSGGVSVAKDKAEIAALQRLVDEGRASTAQVAELHALEAVLAQITSGN